MHEVAKNARTCGCGHTIIPGEKHLAFIPGSGYMVHICKTCANKLSDLMKIG